MASTGYSVFDNGSLIKYGKIPTTPKGFKSEDLRINHVVNVIENIINEVNEKDVLYIGIDCNANNYYNPTAKTYERIISLVDSQELNKI